MEAVQDEYAVKGWLPARLNLNKGVIRGLIELYAWGLWQLYRLLEKVLQQAFPLYATGEFLDTHMRQIGKDRNPALKARGLVLFHRRPGAAGNVVIKAGRIVRTRPDGRGEIYRFVSTGQVVLPDGADFVAVPVEAEEYGAASNAGAGQICELANTADGIGAVENSAHWLEREGADAETDAAMQRRYALSWEALGGVTSARYKAVALGVSGVADVRIDDQHPRGEGTVDVVVKGVAGLPTPMLLEEVRAALEAEIVINHDVLVKGPEPAPVAISLTLALLHGDETETKTLAENFIRDVFSGVNPLVPGIGIGEDVIRDRLAAGIINLPGVKKIVWGGSLAGGDLEVAPDALALLDSFHASVEWADQP
jgi:uncharacterized phage protein gp47/JayE